MKKDLIYDNQRTFFGSRETMTVDEMILALDGIGIAADPSLDGSVGSFRLK